MADPAETPAPPRYRCDACGNLTRFDVTSTRRMRAFPLCAGGGDLAEEDGEVCKETTGDVACRWCGNGRAVHPVTEGS